MIDARDLQLTVRRFRMRVYWLDLPGGRVTWNVGAMERDRDVGRFGPPVRISTDCLPDEPGPHIDRTRVEWIKRHREVLHSPALAIEGDPIPGAHSLWTFVDGNHRLTARQELGLRDFRTFIVPRDREHRYRVDLPTAGETG